MQGERIPFPFRKGSPLVQPGIIQQIISRELGFDCCAALALCFLAGGIHGVLSLYE